MLTIKEALLAAEVADNWPEGNPRKYWIKKDKITDVLNGESPVEVFYAIIEGILSLEDC